jgi:hypothetical protein
VPPTSFRSIRPWLVLACILAIYVYNVERWHPTAFFARLQDDSIYFSSAKALAEGQSYVIPSFPGTPRQTKYPLLYPYLLSWVWKWHPIFPDNLKYGVWITEFFGCWSLVAAFLLLRKLPGLTEASALLLTGLYALQPDFLRFSGSIMSDVPFAALLLTVLVLGDSATRSGAAPRLAIAAGAFAGLSMGMRTIGIAVVAGITGTALIRRGYRQAMLIGATALVVIAMVGSWPIHRAAEQAPGGSSALEPGWNQVLAYYTNYMQFQWQMGVPTIGAFLSMVKLNLLQILASPGWIFAGPLPQWAMPLVAVLSVPAWLGIVRQVRREEWQPIWIVALCYCAILMVWPYPQPERYLLAFIPLFFAGLWFEMFRLGALLLANLRREAPLPQRMLAGGLATILIGVLAFDAWNVLVRDPRQLRLAAESQFRALEERKQAYQWLREHTAPGDRIATYDDVVMYLYTGRQGIRPIVFLPANGYMSDTKSEEQDLAHIADAPRHIGARYWLTTSDDYDTEVDKERIEARMAEIKTVLPLVYKSRENTAQVYDASCLVEGKDPRCARAAEVLFPSENRR